MTISKDFIWGAATASFQIEGGVNNQARGLSNWDVFCETKGRVSDGHTGLIAADHYGHLDEDLKIIKELGLQAYRFSVSWPRILPEGTGKINEKGIDFYDRLIDGLLEQGVDPYLTVFHWDLPYALHLKGGWLNPDISSQIEEYSEILVDRFSDRVSNWITLNEPQCFIGLSYQIGEHAPGYKVSDRELAQAVHNSLLAHGKITRAIRSRSKKDPKICYTQATPLSSIPSSPADIEAARCNQFSVPKDFANCGSIYADPIFLGHYPQEYLDRYQYILPRIDNDDMKLISQPIDFFGINLYFGDYIKDDKGKPVVLKREPGFAKTTYNWPVYEECMYWANKFCYERYKHPIIITENGMSNNDWVFTDGKVHDSNRIDFINRYLSQMMRAIKDGVDIRGYFHWSLLDNFEWSRGYNQRFGIVHVDYQTGVRTIKDSAYHYKNIIDSNGQIIADMNL